MTELAKGVQPIAREFFGIDAVAMAYAKRENLICLDGSIVCWNCRHFEASLPSLHCAACRAASIERTTQARLAEAKEHPEDRRWRAMRHNMAHDQRLDRMGGLRLIKAAGELKSSNITRRLELQAAFDKRFGAALFKSVASSYAPDEPDRRSNDND